MRRCEIWDAVIAEYESLKQKEGDTRPLLEIAVEYNDTVFYTDKVSLNCCYYMKDFVNELRIDGDC